MTSPSFDSTAVASWLKLTRPETDALDLIVPAVASYIDGLDSAPRLPPVGVELIGAWAPQTYLAALMLAGKLYSRRNSPNGIAAFSDAGVTFVAKYDPEVSRLLRIDGWAKPAIG